jgi:hypothetical protein
MRGRFKGHVGRVQGSDQESVGWIQGAGGLNLNDVISNRVQGCGMRENQNW